MGRTLAFHMADLSSLPGIPYWVVQALPGDMSKHWPKPSALRKELCLTWITFASQDWPKGSEEN